MSIPFNRPYVGQQESLNFAQVLRSQHLRGDGEFTQRCHRWLEENLAVKRALLTHSCTAALEMAALLAEVGPGDEVIMPSYTFVSTANAFVLRGATPVFVDIDPTTLCLDVSAAAAAVTNKTRAIVPVHYAGVSCDMDLVMDEANRHGLLVIEDAAQSITSTFRGRMLGSIGHLAALSFHDTKNIISGEGGALLVNDQRFVDRAEIIREKGTNRRRFMRGEVDKYTWVDVGSSYLPSELIAAVLLPQLQQARSIIDQRMRVWDKYHAAFSQLEERGCFQRPAEFKQGQHNAHMYYVLLPSLQARTELMGFLSAAEIRSVFHYVPLHSSPAGRKYGRTAGAMGVTDSVADRLLRLPLWVGMDAEVDRVISAVEGFFR